MNIIRAPSFFCAFIQFSKQDRGDIPLIPIGWGPIYINIRLSSWRSGKNPNILQSENNVILSWIHIYIYVNLYKKQKPLFQSFFTSKPRHNGGSCWQFWTAFCFIFLLNSITETEFLLFVVKLIHRYGAL